MMRVGLALLFILSLGGIGTYFYSIGAAALKDAERPRLVLLYATCTVNKRFLQPHNPSVDYTPALARFAAESLVFMRHQTESGQSGVAFASLFSGQHSTGHGIYRHPTRLADEVYLIAEAFRDNGYETFFWADHPMASPELNYAQGVEEENVFWQSRGPLERPENRLFLQAEDPRFQGLLDDLQRDPTRQAFVQTNFTVTHGLYKKERVPEFCASYPDRCVGLSGERFDEYWKLFAQNFAGWMLDFDRTVAKLGLTPAEANNLIRFVEMVYQANVHHLDTLFGEVIEEIRARDLMKDSLIVFTADHGETMYRKDSLFNWSHGFELSPEVLQIPLILFSPDVRPGIYEQVTGSVDVFPTIAGLANLRLPQIRIAGVDLSDAVSGKRPPPDLVAFSHTALVPQQQEQMLRRRKRKATGHLESLAREPKDMWVAARDGDIVYQIAKRDGRFQSYVFDWANDPDQTNNLFDPNSQSDANMMRRLAEYKAELVEAFAAWEALRGGHLPSERQEEILRSLGYID